jgi:hypothetical protein
MPAMFMEAYKHTLGLERITAKPKKQFVSVPNRIESLDIQLATVQAKTLNFRYG